VIVSSILPHQLKVENSVNDGPKLLKSYLAYAMDVSKGNYKPKPYHSEKYRANWLLKQQLAQQNEAYLEELPFSDLTVKQANLYQSLILTDDDLFFEHLSPKETYAYIPEGLRAKGWQFKRIYSRQFWKNESIL
jgi:hypothetical protein